MKAAVIYQYGSPDEFKVINLPEPQVKDDEILVRVHAASINPIDWRLRKGQLRFLLWRKFPLILGADISGEIIKLGKNVQGFKEKDEVFAMLRPLENGAYAEYVAVPAIDVALKPKNLSFEEAAAVPLAALTALQALRDLGRIQADFKVLINGSSGGVGTFAVQLAKVFGAYVTAVSSSEGIELAKQLGAETVIDYRERNFTKDSKVYDIIFDVVANSSYFKCRDLLKSEGIYITTLPSLANCLMCVLTQFWKRPKATMVLTKPSGKDLDEIRFWIEQGSVKPIIDSIYPLEELNKAHQRSEDHHVKGKIVIKVV